MVQIIKTPFWTLEEIRNSIDNALRLDLGLGEKTVAWLEAMQANPDLTPYSAYLQFDTGFKLGLFDDSILLAFYNVRKWHVEPKEE